MEGWRPDLVLREPAELASYVVATEHGIPHVQTNIGLSVLDDRSLPLLAQTLADVGCPVERLAAAPRWTVVPPSFACRAPSPPARCATAASPGSTPSPRCRTDGRATSVRSST